MWWMVERGRMSELTHTKINKCFLKNHGILLLTSSTRALDRAFEDPEIL